MLTISAEHGTNTKQTNFDKERSLESHEESNSKKKMSKTEMTTVKMEQKETKMKLLAVSTIKSETRETGKSSLKTTRSGNKSKLKQEENECSRWRCEQSRYEMI